MKFTEGAFRDWGYEVAEEEYGDDVITEDQLWEAHDGEQPEGTLVVRTASRTTCSSSFSPAPTSTPSSRR